MLGERQGALGGCVGYDTLVLPRSLFSGSQILCLQETHVYQFIREQSRGGKTAHLGGGWGGGGGYLQYNTAPVTKVRKRLLFSL